jgi:D-psicose/D-tagatose/L-ribulose 3-epimerase
MRIGANSFLWTETITSNDFDLLDRIAAAGLDGIEIGLLDPSTLPTKTLRQALEERNLACTMCCVIPREASLIASVAGERRRGQQHVARCIQIAAEVGATTLCGPLYAPVGQFTGVRRTPNEWARAVEGWQALAPLAASCNVEIALEPLNRYETYFLNTVADAVQLCEEIGHPVVGILIDTYHANIEEKSIGKALQLASTRLMHVHSSESDRGTPGTGGVRWDEFFEALHVLRYNKWLTIEGFGFSLGALSAAASIWRDLAPSPNDIAFSGAAFLREQLASTSKPSFVSSPPH